MKKDCGYNLNKLYVDGIMTSNNLLMQLQADLSGIPVCKYNNDWEINVEILYLTLNTFYFLVKSMHTNTTALGVAMAAGLADGINVITKYVYYCKAYNME